MSGNERAVQRGMRKLEQGKPAVKDPVPRQPRQSRAQQVKNKSAAPLQITAEQILREAHEHKEVLTEPPTQRIANEEELLEYRMRKRREFEDGIRKNRVNMGAWMKYAVWEVQQKDFDRARSVFERALDVDYTNTSIWLKYVEMEMKNGFVNFARNLWDRVVQLLPRVDQFWYKYALMEEMLENLPRARQIFERWMQWKPGFSAWGSYIKFEQRHDNIEQARQIYARFVKAHPEVRTYIKWAKFEGRMKQRDKARAVYEQALQELGEDANDEELFLAFAKFEEMCGEWDRARSIYKYALDHVPKHRAMHLYGMYTSFEKQHGDRNNVEEVILSKRRFQYEEDLKTNPKNYDTWFDYLRLEESKGDPAKIRELYERAIGQVPPIAEKRYWERYIYLWISFAIYEELGAKDLTRTRQVYQKALEIIPHRQFTFTKIWIMAAEFEIRCKDLDAFRKLLGTALGMCPREKIFKRYIELERLLGQADRCRKLYEKYLEFMPTSCEAWSKFAELEASFSEADRARAIFELAVEQQELDQPEVVWKAYIDFEIKQGAADRTRVLYKRLLDRTKHVKVWISRAQFEAQVQEPELARLVFQEADKYFKEQEGAKEERVMLIESWLEFEKAFGTADHVREVSMKLPKKVKRRRERKGDDGSTLGFEEFYDYIFPDEDNKAGNLKILEMARAWKKQKTGSS